MNLKLSLRLQYSIHRIREGKDGHSITGSFILQQSVTGYEGSQVRRLELIVLDGAINDIDVSIDRLQSNEVSIHGGLNGGPNLFLIDNLDVAVDQNPFPFRHGRVPAGLLEGDGLPLH
jgi:hypothetical protein